MYRSVYKLIIIMKLNFHSDSVFKSRLRKCWRSWILNILLAMCGQMLVICSAAIPSDGLAPVWSAQTWTLGTLFTHIIVTCKPPCRKHKIHLNIFHLQAMTARTGQVQGTDGKKVRGSRIGQCGRNVLRHVEKCKCCKVLLNLSLNM